MKERFWSKVVQTDDCWTWQGSTNRGGYGQFRVEGRPHGAHRVAWELTYGPIPPRSMVLHSCDNRRCVRPDHLRIGSADDNMTDQLVRGRRPKHYDPLVSLRYAAALLGVQAATLRQQIANGRLTATMLGGWHVRMSEVERYRRESGRVKP